MSPNSILGVARLWRGAEIWATRCLAYTLDSVDDCNICVPGWRGHAHNPPPLHPEFAQLGACQLFGHAVGCVTRNQVDMRVDVFAHVHRHVRQYLYAVIRKSSKAFVEFYHNTGGISCCRRRLLAVVTMSPFGWACPASPAITLCLSVLCARMSDNILQQGTLGRRIDRHNTGLDAAT